MAAKTLVRSGGASLINRLLNLSKNSLIPQNPNTTPRLFPPIYFPNSDAFDSSHFVSTQGSFSPFAFPSLSFFLPNADELEEPMLLFPKRTFQPSLIRRKRNHGFFARKATKGGRKVIARRVAKGRARITA